jgi:hypothetical protein
MRQLISTLFITFLFSYTQISAQEINRDPTFLVTGAGFLNTKRVNPGIEGKSLLFNKFIEAHIYLVGNKQKHSEISNYDLYTKSIVVLLNGVEFELSIDKLDSIIFPLNGERLKLERQTLYKGVGMDMLVQPLCKTQIRLLIKQLTIEVIKPNYNELLNVGSRDYTIIKKFNYFLCDYNNNCSRFKVRQTDLLKLDDRDILTSKIKSIDYNAIIDTDLCELLMDIDNSSGVK